MNSVNRIILKLDEGETKIETQSGLSLYNELEYRPGAAAPVNGVCWNLSRPLVLTNSPSKREYLRKGKIGQYKFNDFSNPLQDGDRVWFTHQANQQEQWMWEGRDYWVPFDDLLFYERDGKPHAMPGIVLVKPVKIEKSFLEYKTQELEYVEGKRSPDLLKGEVVSVGEPLRGQESPIYAPGDVIVFQSRWVDTSMRFHHEILWGVDMEEVVLVLPEHAKAGDEVL